MLSEHILHRIDSYRARCLIIGIAGVVIALIGGTVAALVNTEAGIEKVFQPFLVAFIPAVGLSVGALAAVMLHHLCGGAWSSMIQRICEAASRTIPHVFVFGLIVMLGSVYFTHIYPWTDQEYVDANHIVALKTPMLNVYGYTIAYLACFGIWLLFMFLYNSWSRRLDETGDVAYIGRMQFWSGPGLVLYVVTLTLSGTYWTMSLEPIWFSTIYGAWLIAGFNLTVISLSVIVLTLLGREEPIASKLTERHLHHLGNLLLGFVVFWAYVSFCQFLLIWNANLPEEIGWYMNRQGQMTIVSVILMVFQWFIPMILLFQRPLKKNPITLRRIAIYLLCMRVVDLYWNIVPSFEGNAQRIDPVTVFLVLAAVIGIHGVWAWVFLGELKKYPILPIKDPRTTLNFLKDSHHHHTEVTGHA